MRLFTALDLPSDVIARLEDLLSRLRPLARIHWSRPENLHITTKFIGNWPEERLDELKMKLGELSARDPLYVHIQSLGFFPNPKSPRVFWCGVEALGLQALAAATDAAMASLGIAAENRPYAPHLTLARIKQRLELSALHRAIASEASLDFGSFEARTYFLYSSQLKRSGSVYTKVAEFPLSLS